MSDTIEKAWEGYRTEVMPSNAPAVQFMECRMAFYAGVQSMLTLLTLIEERSATEDEAARRIQNLADELAEWAQSVSDGAYVFTCGDCQVAFEHAERMIWRYEAPEFGFKYEGPPIHDECLGLRIQSHAAHKRGLDS